MIISARSCPTIKQSPQKKGGVVNEMSFYPLGRGALLSGLVWGCRGVTVLLR